MLDRHGEVMLDVGRLPLVAVVIAPTGTPFPAGDGSDLVDRPEWELVSPVAPDYADGHSIAATDRPDAAE